MRYRKLDPNGDYQFGHSSADIWHNEVEGVGQAIKTRLGLYEGEWFLDKTEGTPWGGMPINDLVVARGQILGNNTQETRDVALKIRVLGTPGVLSISNYSSEVDPDTRGFTVNMTVDTIYGQLAIAGTQAAESDVFALDFTALDSDTGLG